MKQIKLTTEELINKINDYENDVRTYIIYLDIVHREDINDSLFKLLTNDADLLDITEDKIILSRDATINIYRAMLNCIKKYEDDLKLSVNEVLPVSLMDMTNGIEYYSDIQIR